MGILNFLMAKKNETNPLAAAGAASVATTAGSATEAPAIGSRSVAMDMETYLASDEKEWLNYLRKPIRPFRKPGVTMQDEYQQWLAARARMRAAASGNN
jgi:hypothetical protein